LCLVQISDVDERNTAFAKAANTVLESINPIQMQLQQQQQQQQQLRGGLINSQVCRGRISFLFGFVFRSCCFLG